MKSKYKNSRKITSRISREIREKNYFEFLEKFSRRTQNNQSAYWASFSLKVKKLPQCSGVNYSPKIEDRKKLGLLFW
jgi:hypothetical protein